MKGRAVWGGVSGRSIGEQSSGGMAVKSVQEKGGEEGASAWLSEGSRGSAEKRG